MTWPVFSTFTAAASMQRSEENNDDRILLCFSLACATLSRLLDASRFSLRPPRIRRPMDGQIYRSYTRHATETTNKQTRKQTLIHQVGVCVPFPVCGTSREGGSIRLVPGWHGSSRTKRAAKWINNKIVQLILYLCS